MDCIVWGFALLGCFFVLLCCGGGATFSHCKICFFVLLRCGRRQLPQSRACGARQLPREGAFFSHRQGSALKYKSFGREIFPYYMDFLRTRLPREGAAERLKELPSTRTEVKVLQLIPRGFPAVQYQNRDFPPQKIHPKPQPAPQSRANNTERQIKKMANSRIIPRA